MAQTDAQRRASDAVASWMAEREWNISQLVAATGADPGTIGDFLNGKRWPKIGTQGKIEKALAWPPGTLRAIARGEDPPRTTPEPATSPRDRERDAYREAVMASSLSDRDKRLLLAQFETMLTDTPEPPSGEIRRGA